jgi:hypothetical protein
VVLSLFEFYDRTADQPLSAIPNTSGGGRVQSMGPAMLMGAADIASTLTSERDKDAELVKELVEEKKRFGELGIKYAVILLLGKGHMTEPGTDDRLAALRRASGLDTRSLFVLPPGGPGEMPTFVNALYKTLQGQEVGPSFYRELARRAKKKRTRVATQANALRPASGELSTGCLLPPDAWAVRYEFKMGIFCEFSQDFNRAVR